MTVTTLEDWDGVDKVSAALCYLEYPEREDYLKALEYTGDQIGEGRRAYRQSKDIYGILHKLFTDKEILDIYFGLEHVNPL